MYRILEFFPLLKGKVTPVYRSGSEGIKYPFTYLYKTRNPNIKCRLKSKGKCRLTFQVI